MRRRKNNGFVRFPREFTRENPTPSTIFRASRITNVHSFVCIYIYECIYGLCDQVKFRHYILRSLCPKSKRFVRMKRRKYPYRVGGIYGITTNRLFGLNLFFISNSTKPLPRPIGIVRTQYTVYKLTVGRNLPLFFP